MIVRDEPVGVLKVVKFNGDPPETGPVWGLPKMGSFVEHVWVPSRGRGTVVARIDDDYVKVLWPCDGDGMFEYPGGKAIKFVNSEEKDGVLHMHFTATVAKPINYIKMTYKV